MSASVRSIRNMHGTFEAADRAGAHGHDAGLPHLKCVILPGHESPRIGVTHSASWPRTVTHLPANCDKRAAARLGARPAPRRTALDSFTLAVVTHLPSSTTTARPASAQAMLWSRTRVA